MGSVGGICTFRPALLEGVILPALTMGAAHPAVARAALRAWRPTPDRLEVLCVEVSRTLRLGVPPGEQAQRLFQALVEDLCVGRALCLGRRFASATYLDPGHDPGLTELLELLDRRGRVWTHGSGGFLEGVHGWLDPEETELLALHLEGLRTSELVAVRRFAQNAAQAHQGVLWGADLDIFYGD